MGSFPVLHIHMSSEGTLRWSILSNMHVFVVQESMLKAIVSLIPLLSIISCQVSHTHTPKKTAQGSICQKEATHQ